MKDRRVQTVLVVEDNADSAKLVSRVLRDRGYVVSIVGGAEEARAFARESSFDLLVSDIGLPDGDGCELLAEFRKLYDIRGIAVTGHAYESDRTRCEAAGFSRFLVKPVSLDDLTSAVDEVMTTQRERGAATQSHRAS